MIAVGFPFRLRVEAAGGSKNADGDVGDFTSVVFCRFDRREVAGKRPGTSDETWAPKRPAPASSAFRFLVGGLGVGEEVPVERWCRDLVTLRPEVVAVVSRVVNDGPGEGGE